MLFLTFESQKMQLLTVSVHRAVIHAIYPLNLMPWDQFFYGLSFGVKLLGTMSKSMKPCFDLWPITPSNLPLNLSPYNDHMSVRGTYNLDKVCKKSK